MSETSLNLSRPLVVFDLETTGINTTTDRIVELALVRLMPDGTRETKSWLVNPGMPIPSAAAAVHGIHDDDVADAPSFQAVATEIHAEFSGCDLSGFGIMRFDIPLLAAEFGRIDLPFPDEGTCVIDTHKIFVRQEPRNLTAAVATYCNRSHDGAHRAEADAVAAADVLEAQLTKYDDLPRAVEALHELLNPRDPSWVDSEGKIAWVDGEVTLTFGKHQGTPLRQLASEEKGYLEWILKKDFPPDTCAIVSDALAGRFPQGPEATS